jgi:hypothetical protein
MVKAQQDLSSVLRTVCDSRAGVMAQVEDANRRLTYSLESRATAIDELLREVKSDFLNIWAPLLCGASLLVGLFLGIGLQHWRDLPSAPSAAPPPAALQPAPVPSSSDEHGEARSKPNTPRRGQRSNGILADHER